MKTLTKSRAAVVPVKEQEPASARALVAFGMLAACAFSLVPSLAHAQEVGGGGGQMASLLSWFITNILHYALSAGVLMLAMLMFFLRFRWEIVGLVATGGLIAANYTTIAGFFGV